MAANTNATQETTIKLMLSGSGCQRLISPILDRSLELTYLTMLTTAGVTAMLLCTVYTPSAISNIDSIICVTKRHRCHFPWSSIRKGDILLGSRSPLHEG